MDPNHYLSSDDVARELGITSDSLRRYRSDSKPGRKYGGHPFPAPDRTDPHGRGGRQQQWHRDRLPEIRAWAATRAGRGQGGGRPWPPPESTTVPDGGPFLVRLATGRGETHDGHPTRRTTAGAPVPLCSPAQMAALRGRVSYERAEGTVTCWRCLAMAEGDTGGSGE